WSSDVCSSDLHGTSIPGDWEPCPGVRTASACVTSLANTSGASARDVAEHQVLPGSLEELSKRTADRRVRIPARVEAHHKPRALASLPTISPTRSTSASRGSVALRPVSSAARFSRYRTVLGCTYSWRAHASSTPPASR